MIQLQMKMVEKTQALPIQEKAQEIIPNFVE